MIGTGQQFIVCDVCRLLDYDTTVKDCVYCGLCDAWICHDDINKWGRRIQAALKRKLEPGYSGLDNYTELLQGAQYDSTSSQRTDD